jgi:hypothetical protein
VNRNAAGPWLLVVGMHRSGTSAVTGAIGALGFNLVSPDDRLSSHASNPEHWESLSILLHNDAILEHFGGTWDAPPRLPQGWENEPGLPDRTEAAKRLAAAYPDPGPSVWKDPRACLLLPYWLQVLGAPSAAVFVWRAPLAVARSLQRRNGLPVPYGVALWERYNRSALGDLADSDVYVLEYDAMVEDPEASLRGLTGWLSSVGTFDGMRQWDMDSALSAVSATLRHESAKGGTEDDRVVLDEQRQLVAHLREVAGGHRSLPPPPGLESPWTTAMLEASRRAGTLELRKLQRELEHCEAERDWFASELEEAHSLLARLKGSSSWRITAPLRSIAAVRAARRSPAGRTGVEE